MKETYDIVYPVQAKSPQNVIKEPGESGKWKVESELINITVAVKILDINVIYNFAGPGLRSLFHDNSIAFINSFTCLFILIVFNYACN